MSEVVVLSVSKDENLQAFSQYLWAQGVSHRIIEQQDSQLLLVGNMAVAQQVRTAYEKMLAGDEPTPAIDLPAKPAPAQVFSKMLRLLPVTLSLVVLSVLGFALVYLDRDFAVVKYLTFFDFEHDRTKVVFLLPQGQYWRLITPVFLHFGLLHIAFNMALLWFIGHRIELIQGSAKLLGIVLLIGMGSNIVQAMLSGAAIFGGMSGVVYGLLGYGWVWSYIRPDQHLHIPMVLIYFSLFMLLMGFMGVIDMLGMGRVANAAHLGGLLMGCIIGLGAGLMSKSMAR